MPPCVIWQSRSYLVMFDRHHVVSRAPPRPRDSVATRVAMRRRPCRSDARPSTGYLRFLGAFNGHGVPGLGGTIPGSVVTGFAGKNVDGTIDGGGCGAPSTQVRLSSGCMSGGTCTETGVVVGPVGARDTVVFVASSTCDRMRSISSLSSTTST